MPLFGSNAIEFTPPADEKPLGPPADCT